jgi:hypothetical protein
VRQGAPAHRPWLVPIAARRLSGRTSDSPREQSVRAARLFSPWWPLADRGRPAGCRSDRPVR